MSNLYNLFLGYHSGEEKHSYKKAIQIKMALRMTGYVEIILIVIFLRKVEASQYDEQ
jgi:hypothetical protein